MSKEGYLQTKVGDLQERISQAEEKVNSLLETISKKEQEISLLMKTLDDLTTRSVTVLDKKEYMRSVMFKAVSAAKEEHKQQFGIIHKNLKREINVFFKLMASDLSEELTEKVAIGFLLVKYLADKRLIDPHEFHHFADEHFDEVTSQANKLKFADFVLK